MKTIKIIDLLNKIANGENAPNTIRINGFSFIFNSYTSIDCYYTEESSNKFWLSFMSIDLTDEIEILYEEDEFEDIDTDFESGDTVQVVHQLLDKIRPLIRNQKKIIERLNGGNDE